MNIQPIETIYKGYRFRSRLEARWAVLLDELGAQWEYEPEGFDLGDGLKYLPDFRVHNVHINEPGDEPITLYIEVKGNLTESDLQKIERFAENEPILLVGEIPYASGSPYVDDAHSLILNASHWAIMRKCNHSLLYYSFVYVVGNAYRAMIGSSFDGEIVLYGPDYIQNINTLKTVYAYDCARRARFEHGESPF